MLVMHHVQMVCIGKLSTWALDSEGRPWRWGYSEADEQCSTPYYIMTPVCMETPCRVIYLTERSFDIIALTSDGEVFICDSSLNWGARVPILLPTRLIVSSFTALFDSILLLNTEGELYCYENDSEGYFKIETEEPIESILKVKNCIDHLAILTSGSGVHYLFHHEIHARKKATWCRVVASEQRSLTDLYALYSSVGATSGITALGSLAHTSPCDFYDISTMDHIFKRLDRIIYVKHVLFRDDPTRLDIDHPFRTYFAYLRFRHTNQLEAESELSFDLFALGHHYRLTALLKPLVDQITYHLCRLYLDDPVQLIAYLNQHLGFISIAGFWYLEMLCKRFQRSRCTFLDQSLCASIVRFIVERGLKLIYKSPQKKVNYGIVWIQQANLVDIFHSSSKNHKNLYN